MRELFPGFYTPTNQEFKKLWERCVFYLDANVLLNLYRYPTEAKDDLLKVLITVSNRIWLPYQSALEYQKNRLSVIASQRTRFSEVKKIISSTEAKLKEGLERLQLRKRHSSINPDEFLKKTATLFSDFTSHLDGLEKKQIDVYSTDPIREAIESIFKGNIGKPPSDQNELDQLYIEAEARYKKLIPPGYLDAVKEANDETSEYAYAGLTVKRKFGDFVIWKEIIAHAKSNKIEQVIFVTDDDKEDWWLKIDSTADKTIGPRPELIEEIHREAGVRMFHMYSSERFMQFAQDVLDIKLKKDSIGQVREVVESVKGSANIPVVQVSMLDGAEQLVSELKTIGVRASLYESLKHKERLKPEQHESIWVGPRLSASYALKIINLAKNHWPFLKYIALAGDFRPSPPDYVAYQIYLGGSSNTAITRGQRPWMEDDFNGLHDQMSTEEFHNLIRSRYGKEWNPNLTVT